MATTVDICNMALSRLGDRATVASIDPPEGSAQAGHCAQWYPIARDVALEAHSWGFTTVRATAPAIYDNPQPGWLYAYARPNDCLKVLKVVRGQFSDEWWLTDGEPYTVETDLVSGAPIILTNIADATIVYQRRITDTDMFPPTFVSALAWLLASYLAGPIIKGAAGRSAGETCYKAWIGEKMQAAGLDSNQSRRRRAHRPDSIMARGYGRPLNQCAAPIIGPFGWYAYPSSFNG